MIQAKSFRVPLSPSSLALQVQASSDDGPPLLLLHGVSRAGRDFAPLWGALCPRWRLLAVDQRGHGQSDRAESYYVRDYVADAAALLPQICAEPAVVYGHSLGALVAIGLAAASPDRVRAVVLEDPPSPELLANVARSPFFLLFSAMHERAGSKLEISQFARELAEVRLPAGDRDVRLGDLRDGVSLRLVARCLQDVDPAVYDALLAGWDPLESTCRHASLSIL